MRIGILGGTFDPPHIGHLLLAEYAREALNLETILFVPAGENPLKAGHIRTSIEHRVAMLELTIQSDEHFQLSRVDIDRPAPHYSADMVAIIQQQYPNAQLYFLMGGDNLRQLTQWARPQDIYHTARLAVMRRSDEDITPDMHHESLPDLVEYVDMLDAPLHSVWISSSEIVERIQAGKSVRYLIPDVVINYINQHKLYSETV